MFASLFKLLPFITIVGGIAASSPNVKAQIGKVLQTTKVLATQQEVSDLAKLVYLDTIEGTQPKPEDFAQYARGNMRSKNESRGRGAGRDNALDQWGQPYRLAYNKPKRELSVTSAGPDASFDTADDIRSTYPFEMNL